ncbi:RluA family pseudouridine synthase [Alistipes sp. ZOR0009]|jgi:23S rRNA pseudouridine1911/1915/1917 synthase|uniref:RluA family pseudouridine synthase n=1 Tax=Alistipes sp. ZOR0009 TaxID=1339253 RepID=UPI000647A7BA|nr:RluA family pseudouridine synthase [Alistipes sp. ZOR0009]
MSNQKKQPAKERETKSTIQTYTVKNPTTVLAFIQQVHSGKSRSAIKSMLKHRQVAVNDVTVAVDTTPLMEGDVLTINTGKMPERLEHDLLRIVHEDDYIIVIDKKTGLLSVGTEREREQTAYAILKEHVKQLSEHNKIFILHRLDRDTSGVMMFAKNKEVQEQMQRNWNDVVTDRRYVAVVAGDVQRNEGEITTWLKEGGAFSTISSVVANGGQRSTTRYRVLRRAPGFTMVECTLDSGRKNQIRVHMKDLGHSIVGDKKYGGIKSPFGRLALHAHILEFVHPVTGKVLRFESNIPKPFFTVF